MWLDDDEESDDSAGEHNVWNGLLQLFVHYTISPLLVLGLDDSTELWLALSSHFALDVFTMMQQDLAPASQSLLAHRARSRRRPTYLAQ